MPKLRGKRCQLLWRIPGETFRAQSAVQVCHARSQAFRNAPADSRPPRKVLSAFRLALLRPFAALLALALSESARRSTTFQRIRAHADSLHRHIPASDPEAPP